MCMCIYAYTQRTLSFPLTPGLYDRQTASKEGLWRWGRALRGSLMRSCWGHLACEGAWRRLRRPHHSLHLPQEKWRGRHWSLHCWPIMSSGNGMKLCQERIWLHIRLDIMKKFFLQKVAGQWHSSPGKWVQEEFKEHLDNTLKHMVGFLRLSCAEPGVGHN